ncbi:MAG TPA: 4-hydroxy-3-methylbut-2-en-1-yl diphosphate synthase [Spirochaetia bacterium]|nr:4-hydroxy-3-methylbut-2-en-1-yl diphosphate synthase [Spirochaetia bacterium]
MTSRQNTRVIQIGNQKIGGGNPILIQSMTNIPAKKRNESLIQINSLAGSGAELVRLAVLDMEDAQAIQELSEKSPVPLIADIHFDYRLAIESLNRGIAGLRLNPGNIREKDKVKHIVDLAALKKVPIRIGVNAGSLDKTRYPHPTAANMVKSALEHIQILEEIGFYEIKVSLKSSDIRTMIEANRLFSQERDYPLHLGVTEAGTLISSAVRSSIGIGTLLLEGLGDTLRVSVSGDPVKELKIAKEILISLKLRKGVLFIACPTCGRTVVDTEKIALELEEEFGNLDEKLTIAVMGCVVNGPGEAKEADIALIGGEKESLIYLGGSFYKKIPTSKILAEMKEAVSVFLNKREK